MTGAPRRTRRWRWLLALIGLALVLCIGLAAALLVADRLLPATDAAALETALREKAAEAGGVHAALDDLWGRLESGQALRCEAETVSHPYFLAWKGRDRAAHPALAAQADRLNAAIRDLHRAADAWNAVCRGSETAILAEDAAAARAALDRAAASLAALAADLSE